MSLYASLNKCVFNRVLNLSTVSTSLITPGSSFQKWGAHMEKAWSPYLADSVSAAALIAESVQADRVQGGQPGRWVAFHAGTCRPEGAPCIGCGTSLATNGDQTMLGIYDLISSFWQSDARHCSG